MKPLQNIWAWVAGQIVGEVPRDDALCAFDCRKPQCTEGEWKNCTRRLQRAAGELMPGKGTTFRVAGEIDSVEGAAFRVVAGSAHARNFAHRNSASA